MEWHDTFMVPLLSHNFLYCDARNAMGQSIYKYFEVDQQVV